MSDGKIYIVITEDLPKEKEISRNVASQSANNSKEDILTHWAKNQFISETKSLISKAVMYQLSNIGNFTGDYITQTGVNNNIASVNALAQIGIGAYAGFRATGSPIGALIGGGIAMANTLTSTIMNIHSLRVQNQQTNYEIAQLRDRAGLNSLKDGSRGTEN